MVKIDDIPTEEGRIELDKLQDFMDAHNNRVPFIAIKETIQVETEDKTGGVVISFQTPVPFKANYDMEQDKRTVKLYEEGLKLTQKYSKVSGTKLTEAMENLELNDTEELQKNYYLYKLQGMRMGYPRLIPVELYEN